jgi:hypothetical protein
MVEDLEESLAMEGGVSTAVLVTDEPVMVLDFSEVVTPLSGATAAARVGALPFALARIAAGTQRPSWVKPSPTWQALPQTSSRSPRTIV